MKFNYMKSAAIAWLLHAVFLLVQILEEENKNRCYC